nr:DUF11 domain-containing protein [Sphingomonadaceae bacterium]
MASRIDQLKALIAALAALALPMAVSSARAQTISNTATLSWSAGAATIVRQSNRVDLIVERPVVPLTMTTYRFTGGGNAQPLPVPDTICRSSAGDTSITLAGAFAGVARSPASVQQTGQIRAGEPLIVGIASTADNRDPTAIDTLAATLTTPGGDAETLVLRETSVNSGQFVGVVPTKAAPPAPVQGDCSLSLRPGDTLTLSSLRATNGSPLATAPIEVLVDPFGVVFDSGDGAPVAGTRVTLVNADSGAPAAVFGDDGFSAFPATLVTGSTVTDAAGASYAFPAGDYRFPFVRPGRYRLIIEPPQPYTSPSTSTPADLAALRRPDGLPFTLSDASYGAAFMLVDPAPVRIDVPVDKPGGAITITKTASTAVAVPGDAVQYSIHITNTDATRATGAVTLTDHLPDAMRLKRNSVRFSGSLRTYSVSTDGHELTVALPPLAARAAAVVTYLLEVRSDAQSGEAMNRAQAHDTRGAISSIADAAVRIARDDIADRMTIIGRIADGGCAVDPAEARGIGGVRVMMEDGSYAVTGIDGRYHFEGVLPGTHVVQVDPSTLGPHLVPADCARDARSGGSAISRFVEGQGGSLMRADFRAQAGTNATLPATAATRAREIPATDAAAAGAERDWFVGQAPGVGWLFPEADHNPRAKAIRVAIKHLPSQSVALFVNGKPAEPLAFDGTRKNGDGTVAVSLWRALDIGNRDTHLTAEVRDASGAVVERLARTVHYSSSPLHAEFLRDRSVLIADGITRPVVAIRLTDRDGRPVHHGLVGDFSVPAPYYPAVEADAQAAR